MPRGRDRPGPGPLHRAVRVIPSVVMDGDEQAATNPDSAAAGEAKDQDETSSSRWVVELVGVVVAAILVAVLLRTFVVATYSIPSGSMEPTLQIGDRIVVDKLSYHLHGVDRGNIVVFTTPPTEDCAGPPVADLVKRVDRAPRRDHLPAGRERLHQRAPPPRAVPPPGRSDRYLPGSFEQWLCTAPRVSNTRGGRLRHGRQPARVVRQPLLGAYPGVHHRRQGRPAHLATVPHRVLLSPRNLTCLERRSASGHQPSVVRASPSGDD